MGQVTEEFFLNCAVQTRKNFQINFMSLSVIFAIPSATLKILLFEGKRKKKFP